ncbi:hypothetical protein [Streptomyces sp. NPDC055036]
MDLHDGRDLTVSLICHSPPPAIKVPDVPGQPDVSSDVAGPGATGDFDICVDNLQTSGS